MAAFDDLLASNRTYADQFGMSGFDGIAHAGVAMVTCMDSRIDPLAMVGLNAGDAKILRNPGGQVADSTLVALVVSVALLKVDRIMIIEHTECAMAKSTEEELKGRISEKTGVDASWMTLGAIADQRQQIRADVHKVRSHPLIPENVTVGGFIYDVATGLLDPVA